MKNACALSVSLFTLLFLLGLVVMAIAAYAQFSLPGVISEGARVMPVPVRVAAPVANVSSGRDRNATNATSGVSGGTPIAASTRAEGSAVASIGQLQAGGPSAPAYAMPATEPQRIPPEAAAASAADSAAKTVGKGASISAVASDEGKNLTGAGAADKDSDKKADPQEKKPQRSVFSRIAGLFRRIFR